MTSIVEEVETKYEVDRSASLPVLDLLPCVHHVERSELVLRATYFDTDDLVLLGAGITLRRRTGGEDAGWHLKLPDGDRRQEVQLPLDGDRSGPPTALTDVVHGVTRGRPLHPVATIETYRSLARLIGTDNRPIGEVVDDRVTARQSAPPGAQSSWREWEFELARQPDHAVTDVAAALARAGAAPSTRSNKLAFALGFVDSAPSRAAVVAEDAAPPTAAGAIDSYLAGQVAELRAVDPLARADVPDAVQRMQVAGRRIRAVLAVFGPLFDRADARRARHELALAIDDLGAGVLASARYLEAVDSWDRLATRSDDLNGTTDPAMVVRKALRREIRRLATRSAALERATTPDEHDLLLQRAQRTAERLRYAVEAVGPVFGDEATSYADHLADVQDAELAQAALRGVLRKGALRWIKTQGRR